MKKNAIIIFSTILIICAFFTPGIQTKAAATNNASNANLLNTYGKVFGKVGTALVASEILDNNVMNYTNKEYNSVTVGNEMKPDYILGYSANLISISQAKELGYYIPDNYPETTVPKLDFTTVDKMLQVCYDNGLSMRGHTLVWHKQTPDWYFKNGYSKTGNYVSQDIMDKRMEFYIKSVMGHVCSNKYGSVIYAWDVVNEYLHSNDSGIVSGWQQIYGNNLGTKPGFVKSAFEYAYETLSAFGLTDKVKLFYNDYNEYMEVNDIIKLINYINSDKKVCDGIGMQSHLSTQFPSVEYYKSALQEFAKAGFEIQITELDVGCTSFSEQAKYYYDLMSAILSVKKAGGNITALVWWGISDDHSWRSSDKPLLYTDYSTPKEAYYSVLQAYFDAGYTVDFNPFTVNSKFNISSLRPNSILDVKTTITNNYSTSSSASVIVALYDSNNRMANVSYISKNIAVGGTETLDAGFKLPADTNGYRVKVFVCDGTSLTDTDLQSLSNVATMP